VSQTPTIGTTHAHATSYSIDYAVSSIIRQEAADFYKIDGTPTFVFIKNGETLETIEGPEKDEILDAIKKYIGTPAALASA
jgi:thioredoxin-related protein